MKNDGGPAFPVLHTIDGNWVKNPLDEFKGMSLRDYFAAAALKGMCAGLTRFCEDEPAKSAGIIVNRPNDLSEIAYTYADAMLEERKKGV